MFKCVTFHPNSAYTFTGSSDTTCRMWDINRGGSVRLFTGHQGAINCVRVSPDGKTVATAGEDSVIILWDLGSGKRIKTMEGHGKTSIYSLAFSQEGSVLVSGAADNTVRLWDVKMGADSESDLDSERFKPQLKADLNLTDSSVLGNIKDGSSQVKAR